MVYNLCRDSLPNGLWPEMTTTFSPCTKRINSEIRLYKTDS